MAVEFATLKDQRKAKKVVPVDVPYEELLQITDQIVQVMSDIEKLEFEKKEKVGEFTKAIKELDKQQQEMVAVWKSKKREAEIEVLVGFDWEKGEKWFVNEATGELFGPEPITDEDRQAPLPEVAKVELFRPRVVEDASPSPEKTETVKEQQRKRGKVKLRVVSEDAKRVASEIGAEGAVAADKPENQAGMTEIAQALVENSEERGEGFVAPNLAEIEGEKVSEPPAAEDAATFMCPGCRMPTLKSDAEQIKDVEYCFDCADRRCDDCGVMFDARGGCQCRK